ncbi:MAG: ABC transporter permease subunit [FCB group bacterium]|jgi:ABC-2 type transport system permease protein|nr:ABC transporter permease subunit [FCB group bacterium]
MRGAWAVCKREFSSYFTTPVGYVVLATFAVVTGLGFTGSFITYARISKAPSAYGEYVGVPDFEESFLSPFLVFCGLMLMFIGPLVTMRLLAEERNRGTAELLFTHPLRDRDIIFGKYLAALGMVLVLIGVIAVQMGIVSYYADVEPAVLVLGLAAVFLMGAAFCSLGLFVSSLTRNQVTAGTLTFGLWFVLYVLGTFGQDMSDKNPAPATWPEGIQNAVGWGYGIFRQLVQQLPLDSHAKEMAQGVLAPKDIIYYAVFIAFFLFLTFRALDARKWRA